MRFSFANMKIFTKIAVPSVIMLAVAAGIVVYAQSSLTTFKGAIHQLVEVNVKRETAALSGRSSLNRVGQEARSMILESSEAGMTEHEKQFGAALSRLANDIKKILSTTTESDRERALGNQVLAALEGYQKVMQTVFATTRGGEDQKAYEMLKRDALPIFTAIRGALDEIVKLAEADVEAAERAADELHAVTMQRLVVGSALGLLVAMALLAWIALAQVSRPLTAMTGRMEKLAGGDLEIDVVGTERKDEVGALARALDVFKANAIEQKRLETAQAAEQAAKEKRAEAVDQLIKGFDTDVSSILKTVAAASTELESTAQAMTAAAGESSEKATSVAAASEQASSNVQTVASASEEMAASIREISQQVASSQDIAQQANAEAERTNGTVTGLVQAAQKIGEVVELISSIAAQTNLLALNATIEAARAGDAGKGFAVVASEVKSLAAQTAKATEEIASQIQGIQSVSGDAAGAIKGIGGTIAQINEIATSIAAAMEEQGAATQEIARNVQQAAAGTQEVSTNIVAVTAAANQTGAAASQVLGASGELSRQSEELKAKIERFLSDIRAA